MSDALDPLVRVDFRIRAAVEAPAGAAPSFRYDWLRVASRELDGSLHTPYPPVVGDLLRLYGEVCPDDEGLPSKRGGGVYRVIGREWALSSYGSPNWPVMDRQPECVDLLLLLEEAPESLFPGNACASPGYPRWTTEEKQT